MLEQTTNGNDNPELVEESISYNYLHKIIDEDLENQVYHREICTRFPPEPNGYLHIGSAFAININHTVANKYKGFFNLRMDDTNPAKEDMEYVHAIIEDMKWCGYDPEDRIFFGSDYNQQIYDFAIFLIKKDKAYICDLNVNEIREYRGTLTEAGKDSPYRNRSVEENLDLFTRMKNGEFEAGSRVLRAKISMASPNMNMRDPVLYRIQYATHYRTGDDWCVYPMYDYAHPIQDAIEGVTHSMCSNEFADHRPLYEWVLGELEWVEPPKQREFGRLNLTGVVTSKRYLKQLVFGEFVDGWDDPRLPTIKGLRRRGFTPESIRMFLGEIGVPRSITTVDISMLEQCLRMDLKPKAMCVMAVLKPLKLTITNYEENKVETVTIENNAENEEMGTREVPFSKYLYIEQEDFMEVPVKGFHRLFPGNEVRLKGGYFVRCTGVIKDEQTGEVLEVLCTYDPETKSGSGFVGRKVKGTLHWVSRAHAIQAEVRLFDRLLLEQADLKNDEIGWEEKINPESKVILTDCWIENSLQGAPVESKYQFIRNGYFVVDHRLTTDEHLVFNRIVALKDTKKSK